MRRKRKRRRRRRRRGRRRDNQAVLKGMDIQTTLSIDFIFIPSQVVIPIRYIFFVLYLIIFISNLYTSKKMEDTE